MRIMEKLYGTGSYLPLVDSCCCGCTLRTGSKIIGYLFLISSIFSVLWGYRIAWDIITGHNGKTSGIVSLVFLEGMILIILTGVAATFLLTAIKQEKPDNMRFFIVMMWVSVIQSIFVILLSFFVDIRKAIGQMAPARDFGNITPIDSQISLVINSLLNLYFAAVVNSYYVATKENLSIA